MHQKTKVPQKSALLSAIKFVSRFVDNFTYRAVGELARRVVGGSLVQFLFMLACSLPIVILILSPQSFAAEKKMKSSQESESRQPSSETRVVAADANLADEDFEEFESENEVQSARRKDFLKHKKSMAIFDQERKRGIQAQLEEQEQWELRRREALEEELERREQKKEDFDLEAEARDFEEDRWQNRNDYLEIQKKYSALKRKELNNDDWALLEEEELGLRENRPRYDIKKRVLYGAKPKAKNPSSGLGSSMGGGSTSDFSGGHNSSPGGALPNNSFVPPPVLPPDNGNADFVEAPQPPPIPPPIFEDSDFPPPPPPPPPLFDEGDAF